MRLVLTLALAQLRHQGLRWALVVAGVTLVVVVPVLTAGLAHAVQARSIRQTIGSLDTVDRTLLVSQEADSTQRRGTAATNNVDVRLGLATLSSQPVVHTLLYRPISAGGVTFLLGGADDLARNVALTSGRLPRSCTPTRCEVVVIGRTSTALTRGAGTLGVVVVGTARRTSPVLVTGQLDPGSTPLLLAGGAAAAGKLSVLQLFGRHDTWTALVDPDRVVRLGATGWVQQAEALDARLATSVGGTSLEVPSDQLLAGAARATASARRLGLLGGFAAVLLFGFAVVAATTLRGDQGLLSLALRRRGATGFQRAGVTLVEVAVASLLAALVGALAGGIVVAAVWSHGTGLGPAAAAGHALDSALPAAAGLTAGAALVVAAVLLWPEERPRDVWRLLDVIAVATLGAALLAGNRGSTTADQLSSGGDPLVIALPVLTATVAGLVTARLWGPAIALLDRLVGYRVLALRLALVGAVRRPLRPTATAAFLAAAVAAVVFTSTYRASLLANDADQAAYQVPLGTTLAGNLERTVPNAPDAGLGPGVRDFAVVRTPASVPTTPGAATSATLLAPDAEALPLVSRWGRTTASNGSPQALARALRLDIPAAPTLPAGTRAVTATVTGFDPNTALSLWVQSRGGRTAVIDLAVHGGQVTGAVPDLGPGPITVSAFGIGETFNHASRRAHGLGEGTTDRPDLSGRVVVSPLTAVGSGAQVTWLGWGSSSNGVIATAGQLVLTYRIGSDEVVCVPRYAAVAGLVLPVVTDPATASAAHDGTLLLQLDALTALRVRVVGTLPRLPTVSGPFVLADLSSMRPLLDRSEPGRAADEIWVHGSSPELTRFLAHTPLTVTRGATIRDSLDADPIGRGTRVLLLIVAGLALTGAAIALMLLVLGERRDGAGELYAWEADGVAARTLRRMLALRALLVALVGVPIGVGAGLVLAVAGARLVAVDATGTAPTPPIEVSLGGVAAVVALVVGIGGGLAAGAAVAVAALRERHPRAPEIEFR